MSEASSTGKSKKTTSSKSSSSTLERIVPVLMIVTIVLAFGVGVLWQKINNLENATTTAVVAGKVAEGNVPADAPPAPPVNDKLSDDLAEKVPQVVVSSIDEQEEGISAAATEADHLQGNPDAKVFMIEYSDFECPYCQKFHPTAQQALDEYGDDLAWVYRHYPLTFIHSKAQEAAESSECVAELAGNDSFWKFADLVFKDTPNSLSNLSELAVEVGVNQADFEECVESGRYTDIVTEQMNGGSEVGINGTPGTLIINKNGDTWLVPGAVPYESLKEFIDKALAA